MRVALLGLVSASLAKAEASSFLAASGGSTTASRALKTSNFFRPSMGLRKAKLSSTPKPPPVLRGGGGTPSPTAQLSALPFNNGPFWTSQKILWGSNALGYVLSLLTTSHYHVDLLGTGAFALAALPSLLTPSGAAEVPQRVTWSGAAMATWSVKLASYLLYRIISQGGHDSRLDGILDSPYYSAGFWLYSAFWGALVSLPHTLGTTSSLPGSSVALKAGAAMFGLGFGMETMADYQKWAFKRDNPPGTFCNAGLWSISQHPNWCGNFLLWSGIFVMNAPALVEPASSKAGVTIWSRIWRYRRVALALIGPLFLYNLFDSQATGRLLPESLEATKKRYGYGTDPAFTEYIDTTPLIFPKFW